MLQLLIGIVLFFGLHSASIVALPLRDRIVAKSENAWKGIYSIASLVGIVLMVRGYADLRQAPTYLYVSPAWRTAVTSHTNPGELSGGRSTHSNSESEKEVLIFPVFR